MWCAYLCVVVATHVQIVLNNRLISYDVFICTHISQELLSQSELAHFYW